MSAGSKTLRALGRVVRDNWGLLLLLLLWESWIALADLNEIVIPHVWHALADPFRAPGIYLDGIATTFGVAALGLLIGLIFGTGLAAISWFSRVAASITSALALVLASVPVVAFIPILGRLLGYDLRGVLAIVAIITFFPSYVYTSAGLRALPPGGADLLSVLGAGRGAQFRFLALPAALVNWTVALRIAAPTSILAAMVAEFLMGKPGLGTIMRDSMAEYDSRRAMGVSLTAALLSLGCFVVATRLEAAVRARVT